MKAEHTENFYKECYDSLFERYERKCNYESFLEKMLPDFSGLEIPEDAKVKARETVTKLYAQKVADQAKEDLLKEMHIIEEIKAGRAGLGYTTKVQEVHAWYELREGFEFSCYVLAQFKKKYNLQ